MREIVKEASNKKGRMKYENYEEIIASYASISKSFGDRSFSGSKRAVKKATKNLRKDRMMKKAIRY